MNRSELINHIAETNNIAKSEAEKSIKMFTEAITHAASKGENVQLVGFGTFNVKRREERKGRNPKTNEAITIPAANVVSFKPGQALKDAAN